MKRKDFLKISGCTVKQFDNMQARGHLPFRPKFGSVLEDQQREFAHADYSVMDAFRMRVFLDASGNRGLSAEVAKYIAANCDRHLRAASAKVQSAEDLWIFYAQERPSSADDTGQKIVGRTLSAGLLEDLPEFVAQMAMEEIQFLALINASRASHDLLLCAVAARVLGDGCNFARPVWECEAQGVAADTSQGR